MIRITTLTRIAAGALALGLLGAASAAPVLVIGRKSAPAQADLAVLASLSGLPRLVAGEGVAVARAFGPDDEDCLATTRPGGVVTISCAR